VSNGKALDAEMSAWQRSYEVLITWCKEWVAIGTTLKVNDWQPGIMF